MTTSAIRIFPAAAIGFAIACGSQPTNDTPAEPGTAAPRLTSTPPRLQAQGKKIVDPNGNEIQLRGWNWGQWNTVLAGDLADAGYPNAQPGDPSDGRDVLGQGANTVRILLRWWGEYGDDTHQDRWGLPIDSHKEDAPHYVRPQSLALLDWEIREATDHGLWVILAVDSNCGQESPTDADPYCTDGQIIHANFTNDQHMKDEFKAVWDYLAQTYASHDYIAMYEILPEPQFGCLQGESHCDPGAVTSFYSELIPVIRNRDPATPILVGPGSGYAMKHMSEAFIDGGTNLIYTADMLSAEAVHMDDLPGFLQFRSDHTVPLFVQQVGISQDFLIPTQYPTAVQNALGTLDGDNIGWTWWTYREQHGGGDGYAPYWLQSPPDGWAPAQTAGMLDTITHYFGAP